MTELAERVASIEAKQENFEAWQKSQNGCLLRLEAKIENIQKWLTYLLGGVSTSLLLLVLNLIIGRLK